MIMVQIINANYFMRIILLQFILFTVINAEYRTYGNATNNETLRNSDRLRRAPFHRYIPPDTLTATIKDGDKEIHLTWKRAERYLANENLPVYTARIFPWGPGHKKSRVMQRVGRFRMYHDVKHKSAIIYFENLDSIHGVVGRRFLISDLSIDRLSQPLEVDGNNIRRLSHRAHGKKKVPPVLEQTEQTADYNNVLKREIKFEQFNMSSLRSRRDVTPEPFYIETLVLVPYDVVQYTRNGSNAQFLNSLIINYLLHFNAVDMVFANLPTEDFNIYINLAGILIEEEDGAFSRITNYPPFKYENNNELDISFMFEELDRYPNHYDFPFTRDSFDLILISTGRELRFGRRHPNSWHSQSIDLFEERKQNRLSSVPKAIVRSVSTYSSYCIVSHEIGKILGIRQNDPFDQGITENDMQCYGIMQTSQHHCTECIKWSTESTDQLKVFLSENRNRCWLLNKPRSLHPRDTKLISQTPCRQCACFGYNSYGMETENECPLYIPPDTCDMPLQCKHKDARNHKKLESTILPFDGTPCGEKRVCWNEKCTSLERVTSAPTLYKVIRIGEIGNGLLD